MPKKSRKCDLKIEDIPENIKFTFKFCKFQLDFDDDMYNENQQEIITDFVNRIGNKIVVDRTYVENDKFEKTFITKDGWKHIRQVMADTNYGDSTTEDQSDELLYIYDCLINCYIYGLLKDCGYDTDGILVNIKPNSRFMTQITLDTYDEYSKYPGKWQNWSDDYQSRLLKLI